MDKQNETVGSLTTFSPNECIGWFVVLAIVGVATTTINALTVIVYLLEQRLRKRTMHVLGNQPGSCRYVCWRNLLDHRCVHVRIFLRALEDRSTAKGHMANYFDCSHFRL